jgi:hypothetical protein
MRLTPTICAGCVVSGFALMVGSSWIGPAAADERQPRADVKTPAPQTGVTSKVFRIKTRNLGVVEERVRSLLPPEELATVQPFRPVAGQAGGLAGGGIGGGGGAFGLGGIGGMYGFVNQPGGPGLPAGGALGFAGSSVAGNIGAGQPTIKWRMVCDDGTGSLIFRGSAQDIQFVTDLVAVAQLGADDALPAVHHIGVFRLKHVKAAPLVEKLNQLEMDVRMQAFEDSNIIVVAGPEAARAEAAELIKALDIKVEGR